MKYNKLIKELNDVIKVSLEEEEILYENELKDKIHKFIENPKEENLDYLEQQVLGNTFFYRAYYDFYYNSNEKNFQKIINGLYYYVTSYIVAFYEGKTANNYTNSERSSLLLASLMFYDKAEQEILYKEFIADLYVKKKNDLYKGPYCQDSLFQFGFIMYDEYAKSSSNKSWKYFVDKPLSSLYSQYLSLYLSDEDKKLNECINEMCDYHLSKCKDTYTSEFYMLEWRLFATEILTPIFFRHRNGKNIDFISHELIVHFIPFIKQNLTISNDIQKLRNALFIKYDI